ncbi:MAG: flagellar M-ring protein FliF [Treponema sp.]|jgi:flagellar M-ring protein FliF|nr:flagellar M-ring protein FliF [Treponema sp.]
MGEWIKKIVGQIQKLWGKWSLLQKLILVGICVAALAGIIALFSVSTAPTMVPVIDAPVLDEGIRNRILTRINEEGVKTSVSSTGVIMVSDDATARRMRAILVREDLIPSGTSPWELFDRERWTITDFERNVNLQRAITQMVTEHIRALDDVDNANVTLVTPERALFASEQNPVTASVIITPRLGSDITQNRKKIEGIQKLLKFAVAGLQDDTIVITDQNGIVLNDFTGQAESDRLSLIERGNRMIRTLEAQYRAVILKSLQDTFTSDRVRDLNIKIDMDLSKKAINTEEFFPTTIRPRTPGSSYDDSEIVPSVTRSKTTSSTTWKGTGFTPEGPSGVEGQTAPAFRDMSNLYGEVTQETLVDNEEINKRSIQEERSPNIDRVTVSVNIDGTWSIKYDEKRNPVVRPDGSIEREYAPMSPADLRATQTLIQNAIGYNAARGDSVTVQNIGFDRTKQFADEDTAFFKQKQFQSIILIALGGLALLLIGFIVFRIVARRLERKRIMEEAERTKREQEMRDSALMDAERESSELPVSNEERVRMELRENVADVAKNHPEDVAQLLRTWLLEE